MMKHNLVFLKKYLIFYFLLTSSLSYSNNREKKYKKTPHPKKDQNKINILFLGDSLTQGYGVKANEAFPSLVGIKLNNHFKQAIKIINAGSSGATTASAKRRLIWQLKKTSDEKPQFLVLALGANDGLRGLSLAAMERNLEETIDLAILKKVKVLLCGIRVPPSHGPQYSKDFAAVFPRLAKKKSLHLLPFLLESVAAKEELNQADGIHPNAKGHKIIAEKVFNSLKKMIGQK